jgi:hypothetical protein
VKENFKISHKIEMLLIQITVKHWMWIKCKAALWDELSSDDFYQKERRTPYFANKRKPRTCVRIILQFRGSNDFSYDSVLESIVGPVPVAFIFSRRNMTKIKESPATEQKRTRIACGNTKN